MKHTKPQQFLNHLACMAACVMLLMFFVFAWFPEIVRSALLANLFFGVHRIRKAFESRNVDLSIQCQTLQQAARLCLLSVVWWISEPLVKLQDPPKSPD